MGIGTILAYQYFIPITIILLSILLAYLISYLVHHIHKFASQTETNLDNYIVKAMYSPLRWAIVALGFFFAARIAFPSMMIQDFSLVTMFRVIFLLIGAYAISRLIKVIFHWYAEEVSQRSRKKVDDTAFRFIRRFASVLVYVIIFLIIFDTLGFEIGPMLAGLGIAGLAVALALQDTLSNLFSAVYIAADRPINLGDYVEIKSENIAGYVEDISWRTTKIRSWENNRIIIPNSKLAQAIILNYEKPASQMSFVIPVGVAYKSDLAKVEKVTKEVAKKVLKKVAGGVKDFEPLIRYTAFADSAITFNVIMRGEGRVEQFMLKHEFIKELQTAYKKNKIEIPFPQRDVHMKR